MVGIRRRRGVCPWLAIAGAVLAVLVMTSRARAEDDVRAEFDRATAAMAAGEYQRAAETFVALADRAPSNPLAADALFSAAQLYEQRLADPRRAHDLYLRLTREHPSSRTALAARRRAESLRAGLGPEGRGADALARFGEILLHFNRHGEAESLAMAEHLLNENPEWVGRSRVLGWMGDVHLRAGRHARALELYVSAAAAAPPGETGDEQRWAAYRGAGDAALAAGRFDEAERYYRSMLTAGDASRARALDDALERVARQRLRATLYQLSFAVLALVVFGFGVLLRSSADGWRAGLRCLARVPTEVIFMVPIAGLLVVASLTAHYAIAPAVFIICLGGLAITWLSGAGLAAAHARARGAGRIRPWVHIVLAVAGVLALSYIALHHNRLIDMIVDTVRFGPDV